MAQSKTSTQQAHRHMEQGSEQREVQDFVDLTANEAGTDKTTATGIVVEQVDDERQLSGDLFINTPITAASEPVTPTLTLSVGNDAVFVEGSASNKITATTTNMPLLTSVDWTFFSAGSGCGPWAPELDLNGLGFQITYNHSDGDGGHYTFIKGSDGTTELDLPLTWDDNVDNLDGFNGLDALATNGGDTFSGPAVRVIFRDNDPTIAALTHSNSSSVNEADEDTITFTVTLERGLAVYAADYCDFADGDVDPPAESIEVPLVFSGSGITAADISNLTASGDGVTLLDGDGLTPRIRFVAIDDDTATAAEATVTFTIVDDTDNEGSSETLTVALGAQSAFDALNTDWDSVTGTNVGGGAQRDADDNMFNVEITDDDVGALLPGVTIVETDSSTSVKEESGTGNTDTYTIVLNTKPKNTTSSAIHLTSSDETGLTVSPKQLFFFSTGATKLWNVPQTITVTGVSDGVDQAVDRTLSITHTVTSGDSKYNKLEQVLNVNVVDDNVATVPVITVNDLTSITEGSDAVYTITANPVPAADITVNLEVTDAPSPSDFVSDGNTGADKTVTIGTSGTATYTIHTEQDREDEPDGDVTLTVLTGTGYVLGTKHSDTVQVNDDDAATDLVITETGADTTVTEADGAAHTDTWTVVLGSQPTHTVTVSLTASSDAVTLSSSSLTFNPTGSDLWSTPQTVTVTGVSDGVDQSGTPGSRAVTVTHTSASDDTSYDGDTAIVDVTVTDDDVVSRLIAFEHATYEVEEGASLQFRLTKSGASATAVAVPLTYAAGTATAGSDYSNGTASVSMNPTDLLSANQPVATTADADLTEGDETFTILIDSANLPAGFQVGSIASTTVTIKRFRAKSFALVPATANLVEGGTTSLSVTLSRGFHSQEIAASASLNVDVSLGGAATRGTDYTLVCGSNANVSCSNLTSGTPRLAISNATAGVVANVLDIVSTVDQVTENNGETLSLSSGDASTQFNIVDPPSSMTVGWSTAAASGAESSAKVQMALIVHPAGAEITVPLTYSDGTAEEDSDYTAIPSVTVPVNTLVHQVDIPIIDDNIYEGAETFTVSIDSANLPAGVTIGNSGISTVTVTIASDASDAPTVQFAAATFDADEGQPAIVNLELSNPMSVDATIQVLDTPGTASAGTDYTSNQYSATFTALETTTVLHVPTTADKVDDDGETFTLSIDPSGLPSGVTLGSRRDASVTINEGPPVIGFKQATYRVKEGEWQSWEIRLSEPLSQKVSLVVNVDPCIELAGELPCATPADDHPLLGSVREIYPGDTETSVFAPVQTDNKVEGDERFILSIETELEEPTLKVGSAYLPARATVIIEDVPPKDPPPPEDPTISFASSNSSIDENAGSSSLVVNLQPKASKNLTLNYTVSGTATAGDFNIASSGTLNVAKGSSTVSIPVAVVDDAEVETDESVILTLDSGTGYKLGSTLTHTLTIKDDDVPPLPEIAFVQASHQVAEASGGTVSASMTVSPAPSQALTINYSVGGTATAADFTIASSGTVTVPANSTTASISIQVTDDSTYENTETVVLTLSAETTYTIGNINEYTLTITDEDPPISPVVNFAAATSQVDEDTGTAHQIQLQLNPAPDTNISLSFGVAGTATRNTDYSVNLSVPVAAGATSAQLPVNLINDSLQEGTETVIVTILQSTHYQPGNQPKHTINIIDDETPLLVPEVSFAVESSSASEGSGVESITIDLVPSSSDPITINYAVSGTATAPNDYGALGTSISASANQSSVVISVSINDDSTEETAETVVITLLAGTGYTLGTRAVHTLTINDDDSTQPVNSTLEEDIQARIDKTAANGNTWSYNVWRRALAAVRGEDPPDGLQPLTRTRAQQIADNHTSNGNSVLADLWQRIADALSGTPTLPSVSVSAAAASVNEGSTIVYTVTRSGSISAALSVTLNIAESGNFVQSSNEGSKTVSISAGASTANHTISTVQDNVDESNGTVTATIGSSADYNIGSPGSATVTVIDDDGGVVVPVMSISGPTSVTEGNNIVFRVHSNPAPTQSLTVSLNITETNNTSYVSANEKGLRTVTFSSGTTQVPVAVATSDDGLDRPAGTVTATLQTGAGYSIAGGPRSVTINPKQAPPPDSLLISIDDAEVREGQMMPFTIRLSDPLGASERVMVGWRTAAVSGSNAATPGRDFLTRQGQVQFFQEGVATATIYVRTYNDQHDDPNEQFRVVLHELHRYKIVGNTGTGLPAAFSDAEAIGTILNSDPIPEAWLTRFGRTFAQSTIDGIQNRLNAPRRPGLEVSGMSTNIVSSPEHSSQANTAGSSVISTAAQGPQAKRVTNLLSSLQNSGFTLSKSEDQIGGNLAFWGRSSRTDFRGSETGLALDGEVVTGMLGADYARGDWLLGMILAQSEGNGAYRGPANTGGDIESMNLRAAVPWLAWRRSDRLAFWGAAGYGAGAMTLRPGSPAVTDTGVLTTQGMVRPLANEILTTKTGWAMTATGLRGELFSTPGGGPSVAVVADGLWTRTSSERISGLAASGGAVSRMRTGLEGDYSLNLGRLGRLTPSLSVGARHDAGDADTGYGMEFGGSVGWEARELGLKLDLQSRTFVSQQDDVGDEGVSASFSYTAVPGGQQGLSVRMRQVFGGASTGGMDALFNQDFTLGGRSVSVDNKRWTAEAAYGVPTFGERFISSPTVGLATSALGREYSIGWQLMPVVSANAMNLTLGNKLTRRERQFGSPDYGIGFELRAHW